MEEKMENAAQNQEDENILSPAEEETVPEQPKERYVPRPRWQIVMAWVLFGIMILAVASYYYWIAYRYV